MWAQPVLFVAQEGIGNIVDMVVFAYGVDTWVNIENYSRKWMRSAYASQTIKKRFIVLDDQLYNILS